MILIKSPELRKMAQKRPAPRPWELTEEEEQDLEPVPQPWEFSPEEEADLAPIGAPATDDDFQTPGPVAPPLEEPSEEPGFEIKPTTDYTFLPFAPTPDGVIPIHPQQFIGEEVEVPPSQIEDANENLDIREKIFYSLNNSTPMKITYTTLDGGSMTERTINPDYVYWAGTNRHILVAWDRTKDDWRAFAVDNITLAELVDPNEVVEQTG